jgi:hypothetical protein
MADQTDNTQPYTPPDSPVPGVPVEDVIAHATTPPPAAQAPAATPAQPAEPFEYAGADAVAPASAEPLPEGVEEVDHTESADEPDAAPETEQKAEDDVLDTLVPKADPKVWEVGPQGHAREYVQKPLSFIGKMQWFALVGDVLDKAMSGPNGISLNSLFDTPQGRDGQLTVDDFRDADLFVHAVGKLLAVAPDFLVKSYAIWLNVPDYEREIVAAMMKLPEDEGGLNDDDGMEMIEVFIDQNFEALRRFFGEKIGGIQKRIAAKMGQPQQK